jgi:tRNA-2-methylthio-N6-dimethylallyladenosine synthase
MKYYIETFGCQMNTADSQRLAMAMEKMGLQAAPNVAEADVAVVNTCVVRQTSEDKAYGWLQKVSQRKKEQPDFVVGVMGCLVGVKGNQALQRAFPMVDVLLPPSDPQPMVNLLAERIGVAQAEQALAERHQWQDEDFALPLQQRGNLVSAHVPIVYGCSHACTFCIIPFRRGIERSRPIGEIAAEVRSLVRQGVREVTLLGQIVDRYGYDVPNGPQLSDLLRVLNDIPDLERIRFLTSHPNYMSDELLRTVAELPKVCEHIEVPIQAGSDEVLTNMKRGYTAQAYRDLVARIRHFIPNVAIHTDIIVGFPGESEAQFDETYRVLAELALDKVHVARYSPRKGTVSARRLPDDVSDAEKKRRLAQIEGLQAQVQLNINRSYLGQTVEVLVDDTIKGHWSGRTRTNKLIMFDAPGEWRGKLAQVTVTDASAYAMQGKLATADTVGAVEPVGELIVL